MIYITPVGIPILTWQGLWWLALLCFLIGVAGSLVVPLFLHLMDNTKKARARRAAAVPEQAQREIDRLHRLLNEARSRNTELAKENQTFRRLGRERIQFDRYSDSRTRAAMSGREDP